MSWHSHTSAERTSLSVHWHELTSHGWTMRVSLLAAGRSMTTSTFWCDCRNDAGNASVICPSMALHMMSALLSPHAVRNILRACRMVCMPIVMEHGGTGVSEPKLMVISSRDVWSRRMMREVLDSALPGSLVAMFPRRPMPSSIMSMPPMPFMRCSYWRQYACTLSCAMVPSGVNTLLGLMFTRERSLSRSWVMLLCAASGVSG